MFKKTPFNVPLPETGCRYSVSKVVRKTDGQSVDVALVRDFSENFKDFPRQLESEDFSLEAQRKSGLSMKEVNSVVFHDDKLSEKELSAITAELEKDVEPENDD